MKLIALRDFRRTPALKEIEISGTPIHPLQIHKGATFDIGGDKVTELGKLEPEQRQIVAQLVFAGCVGDATDEKVVKAVAASIAEDKKRDENVRKMNEAANNNQLATNFLALLTKSAAAAK